MGRGLGAIICEKFAAEGCNVAINYHSNGEAAEEVARKVQGYNVKAITIQGVTNQLRYRFMQHPNSFQDAGVSEDNSRMIKETVEKLGGIDILIANAGWTRFAKFGDLNAFSDEEWTKVRSTSNTEYVVADLLSAGIPMSYVMCNS